MAKFVFSTILVCLVISNYVNCIERVLHGIERAELDKNWMEEKCKKNNPNNTHVYKHIEEAGTEFAKCVDGIFNIINIRELEHEIGVAKSKGEIDIVFKKICKKSPVIIDCMKNFTSIIDVCLDASEKNTTQISMVVSEALLSFVCHDEGARLALFYSEGGPECFMNKQIAVSQCSNKTSSKYVNFSSIKYDEDQCKNMFESQACILDELKTCNKSITNMIESFFDIGSSSTPCSQFKNAGISLH